MSRATTLRRDQLITSGLAVTAYHTTSRSSDQRSAKRKEHFVTFSKIPGTNEASHRLTVYESAKKSGPNDKELCCVQITRDNLCGIINDTEHLQLSNKYALNIVRTPVKRSTLRNMIHSRQCYNSMLHTLLNIRWGECSQDGCTREATTKMLTSGAAVVEACPYLAIVTKTGTLEIRQKDGSPLSTKKHDMWYKSLKQEINFDYCWSVQLESTSPPFQQLSESNKAFLCLTRHTVSVVFAAGYACILSSTTASCRFKAETQANHVLITIKQMSSASGTKCTVRANHGIARTFLKAVGHVEQPVYITPIELPEPEPLPIKHQHWLLRDTFTELFQGNKPEPDTLKLSLSCIIQLSINLFAAPGQPCWRDLAECLELVIILRTNGAQRWCCERSETQCSRPPEIRFETVSISSRRMSLDDIDMIIRWSCSRYNSPRATGVMLPAMCLLYHWQYVYNKHGVGENPPAAPRACNKLQLRSLLCTIGRNDLVNLLDEWETTMTTI